MTILELDKILRRMILEGNGNNNIYFHRNDISYPIFGTKRDKITPNFNILLLKGDKDATDN